MKRGLLSIDFTILFTVVLIMLSGYVALTSATDDFRKLTVQTVCYILGFIIMLCIYYWDYHSLLRQNSSLYLLCIFLLLIVFPFGIGKEETGAISWIRFGNIGVQPSEFVKPIFALYISFELSDLVKKNSLNAPKELLKFLTKCAVIIFLVILQNDTGTSLVFLFMLIVSLFVSGVSVKYIIIAAITTVIALPVIWIFLADYQKDRITAFLSPDYDLSHSGYQVNLSKLALSSGHFLGQGYGRGAVNSLSYLPEKETDFIFSVIGEEFGIIGTGFLVLLFLILIFRCFSVAKNANDLQGKILTTAITSMITFHTFENIGMTLGLLPVTGIPLPFVSYGGSSIISMSISMGLILSVRRKTYTL